MKEKQQEHGLGAFKSKEEQEFFFHYSNVLQNLWERYSQMVVLAATLSAGNIFFYVQFLLSDKEYGPSEGPIHPFMLLAIGTSAAALVVCGLWRLTTQLMMEKEVFGSRTLTEWYYEICNIELTPWAIKYRRLTQITSVVHLSLPFVFLSCYFGSWLFFYLYLTSNV